MSNVKKPEPAGWGIFYQGVMQGIPRNEQAALAIAEEDYVGHVMAVKPVFSNDQTEAYAAERVREALEQVAKTVLDGIGADTLIASLAIREKAAEEIRALIPKQ